MIKNNNAHWFDWTKILLLSTVFWGISVYPNSSYSLPFTKFAFGYVPFIIPFPKPLPPPGTAINSVPTINHRLLMNGKQYEETTVVPNLNMAKQVTDHNMLLSRYQALSEQESHKMSAAMDTLHQKMYPSPIDPYLPNITFYHPYFYDILYTDTIKRSNWTGDQWEHTPCIVIGGHGTSEDLFLGPLGINEHHSVIYNFDLCDSSFITNLLINDLNLPQKYAGTIYCYACDSASTSNNSFAQLLSTLLAERGYQDIKVAGVMGFFSMHYITKEKLIEILTTDSSNHTQFDFNGTFTNDGLYQWVLQEDCSTITTLKDSWVYFKNGQPSI